MSAADFLSRIARTPARWYTNASRRRVDRIVLHTMETPETPTIAERLGAWWSGTTAPKSSAHYGVDTDSIRQYVLDEDIAWHAAGDNTNTIGIEQAGYAAQTYAQWRDHGSQAMLELSSRLTAALCIKWDIPPRYVDAYGIRRGERGITTHDAVRLAWRKTTHTDPGPHFPMPEYLSKVREHIDRIRRGDASPPPIQEDPNMIPNWLQDAWAWSRFHGFVRNSKPGDSVTVGQLVVILHRFYKMLRRYFIHGEPNPRPTPRDVHKQW